LRRFSQIKIKIRDFFLKKKGGGNFAFVMSKLCTAVSKGGTIQPEYKCLYLFFDFLSYLDEDSKNQ